MISKAILAFNKEMPQTIEVNKLPCLWHFFDFILTKIFYDNFLSCASCQRLSRESRIWPTNSVI